MVNNTTEDRLQIRFSLPREIVAELNFQAEYDKLNGINGHVNRIIKEWLTEHRDRYPAFSAKG